MFILVKRISLVLFSILLFSGCNNTQAGDSVKADKPKGNIKVANAIDPERRDKMQMRKAEIAGIYASPDKVQPLLPGQDTPSFTVQTVAGERFIYRPDQHEKPVVLTFYRGGWCPYCNLHLSEMRKAETELKEKGFDVWFISIDKPELLYESLKNPEVGYTIYSDAELSATRAFRIGFKVDDKTLVKYQDFGIDLEKASGKKHHVLPAPATFILGSDGKIQFQYVNPDYSIRLSPDVLLAAADAYINNAQNRMKRK